MDTNKLYENLVTIVEFLLAKAIAMPEGANVEFKLDFGSRDHYGTIDLMHEKGKKPMVRLYDSIDDSSRWCSHRFYNPHAYEGNTHEEIRTEFLCVERVSKEYAQKVVCGWKLDGLKEELLSEIAAESRQAQAVIDRTKAEEEANNNFEV